jgi:hypothetical protein
MLALNWIAIILAALSAMIVGSIWYGPAFGKMWIKLANVKKDPNFTAGKATIMYLATFVTVLVTATVLAYVTTLIHESTTNSFLLDAVFAAILLSLGTVATRLYMQDSFEGRRKMLSALNISNAIVTYLIMAVIIGLLPV